MQNNDLTNPANAAAYNVSKLRTDIWNRLRDYARHLRRSQGSSDEQSIIASCQEAFEFLEPLEQYCAFPGKTAFNQIRRHFDRGAYEAFAKQVVRLVRMKATNAYRRLDLSRSHIHDYSDLLNVSNITEAIHKELLQEDRPYFEVLVIDDMSTEGEQQLHLSLLELRREEDHFIYDVVVVGTFEDALMAILVNPNIQACLLRYSFPFRSAHSDFHLLKEIFTILGQDPADIESALASERSLLCAAALKNLRPELDLYMVTDAPIEDVIGVASEGVRRVFYHLEDYQDLHLSILKGVYERFETPFFEALRKYSQRPTGMFHALPISRGSTISQSHWIQEFGRFFGNNVFQAMTSATTGGLDSLLQPHGSLKQSQLLAARAFGAQRSYFVTNGTSTANKIVVQALIQPGEIVMLSHDCHKSHPYALILSGAHPLYLDAYPLTQYSMYGAVPLRDIKKQLLALKHAGKLDRVKMLLLTNITFDGVTYDPLKIMSEALAIKPDMVFVWDEAWFAYGRFSPITRRRTAMDAANQLRARLTSDAYKSTYRDWRRKFDAQDKDSESTWLDQELLPDPEQAVVRVYATHSTHKTLTAFRQGSMIHVNDDEFDQRVREPFTEAYMTHTSTSPNYEILASLDMGRRQVELEGFEMVQRSIELAMSLRERIRSDQLLQRYFRVLGPAEMIPKKHRASGLESYYSTETGWNHIEQAWHTDEIVLDPTRITIEIGRTGMDGDTFKNMLMDRFDIQINKTSRNTVLFMVHIGMTRGTISHLVKVLHQVARELDDRLTHQSEVERKIYRRKVTALTQNLPPLPNFSRFHAAFESDGTTSEGDIRKAFFLSYEEATCEHLKLDGSLRKALESGRELVSAVFVTPYPPGFPILVPGQIITREILEFLKAIDVKEIHGYDPQFGLRLFKAEALQEPVTHNTLIDQAIEGASA